MVATAAQETEEGYSLTGKYLRVGGILNIFLMVPISIITTYFMPTILQWIGYEGEIIDISRSFAAVASISHVINRYVSISWKKHFSRIIIVDL